MDKTLQPESIRLLFELDREDDPRLYDDLIRFKKGTKRINRLRLLAHEGVIGQLVSAGGGVAPPSLPVQAVVGPTDIAQSPLDAPGTADVFGAPITEQGVQGKEASHA